MGTSVNFKDSELVAKRWAKALMELAQEDSGISKEDDYLSIGAPIRCTLMKFVRPVINFGIEPMIIILSPFL